jgi:hypothetical protein
MTACESQFNWGGCLQKSNGGVQKANSSNLLLVCVMANVCFTVRLTNRTEILVGHSDPMILRGKVIAQRIKNTPGITG